MERVSQTGTFKCKATDWGVSLTQKSEIPQFVFQANLTAIYDFDSGEWQDYADYEEGTMAFLCLFDRGGEPIRNMEQVMLVFGWDGNSFAGLSEGDYTDLEFQIRIEDNDPAYAEKNPFQVAWIDVADATPGGSVRKLDADALKALDKKFAVKLKKVAKPTGPVSAKPASPKSKTVKPVEVTPLEPEDPAEAPEPEPELTPAEMKMQRNRDQKVKDDATKAAKAAAPKKGMPAMPKKPKESEDSMTQEQAWDVICETAKELGDKCDDDKVNDALFDAMTTVGGEDCDSDLLTGEQWAQVADLVKKTLVGV